MGSVLAINISTERGIAKSSVGQIEVIEGWGLEGDAHGGDWDRQVSILPVESLEKVPAEKKEEVSGGGYTENFTIEGVDPADLAVGNFVSLGQAVIKILHIGKEQYKNHGRPYVVSREGRFGRVVKGGPVKVGDGASVYIFSRDSFLQCVQEGHLTMAQIYLDGGMDPDTRDIYSATALMLAARGGHAPVARALLDKGADVNAGSDDGITALMVAAYTGQAEIVEMLLAAGGDPGLRSDSGLTALSLAREAKQEAVAGLLENSGGL